MFTLKARDVFSLAILKTCAFAFANSIDTNLTSPKKRTIDAQDDGMQSSVPQKGNVRMDIQKHTTHT
jgi:hypothetical protein